VRGCLQVTGIYRAVPIRVAPNRRSFKSVYKTYLDIIHIKKDEAERMRNEAAAEPNATGPRAHGKFTEDDRSEQFTPAQVPTYPPTHAHGNPPQHTRRHPSTAPHRRKEAAVATPSAHQMPPFNNCTAAGLVHARLHQHPRHLHGLARRPAAHGAVKNTPRVSHSSLY
jgi:hypothetical protein